MSNNDPRQTTPADALEAAATLLEIINPQVIAGLGQAAAAEGRPEATDISRLRQASGKILHVLTTLGDALDQAESRPEAAAEPEEPQAPQPEAHGAGAEEAAAEDHEDITGLVSHWASRRTFFTLAELRDHLLLNRAVRPEEVSGSKIKTVFRQLQAQVVDYNATKGSRVAWVENPYQGRGPKQYSLAVYAEPPAGEAVTPAAPPQAPPQAVAPAPAEAKPKTPPAAEPVVRPEQASVPPVGEVETLAVIAVLKSIGGAGRARQVEEGLAARLNLSRAAARLALIPVVEAGIIGRKSISGARGYALPETEVLPPAPKVSAEDNLTRLEREAEFYVRTAGQVMTELIKLGYATQGYSYKDLWKLVQPDLQEHLDFDTFKSFVRQMKEDGLVNIMENARLDSRSPRSNVIRGPKVGFANKEIRKAWKENPGKKLIELTALTHDRLISSIE